jgi:hypothetical protein
MQAYILREYNISSDSKPGWYVSEDENELLRSAPERQRYDFHPAEVDPQVFEESKRNRPNALSDLLVLAEIRDRKQNAAHQRTKPMGDDSNKCRCSRRGRRG